MNDLLTLVQLRAQADFILAEWMKRPKDQQEKLWPSPATHRFLHALADRYAEGAIDGDDVSRIAHSWSHFLLLAVKATLEKQPKERVCIAAMRLNRLCDELGTTTDWIMKGIAPKESE